MNSINAVMSQTPFRHAGHQAQFGRVEGRYHGLAKNSAQFYILFMQSNLWLLC
ncbi:MAG: hypothetical protein WCA85_01690 [Paraburkholderia sp.]|uniref:hypothetical protein n=1 Tax=Paraburkholderia sp. TaxID=1926495 RepID=UPI003C64C843